VRFPSGAVWTRHKDGTEFKTSPDGERLLVELPGSVLVIKTSVVCEELNAAIFHGA
jgi:hypothetical protein